jgi:rhodanese-related sulfurtransferase/predicted DsbA family dithiol-disulfide isomerase
VTIIEFADFECPVCVRAQAAVQEIRARYGERIRLVFRQFPLNQIHPWAEKAAEASECAAEQGKFWEAVEKFYTWQNDLSEDALRRYAGELGLNQNRFNQCLASGSMAGRVRRDMDDGRALGVRATPTFFIGQQRIEGPLSVAQFSQLVDQELASAGAAMAKAPEPAANTSPPIRRAQPATPRARTSPAPTASNPSSASAGLPSLNSGGIFAKFQAPSTACSEEEATKQQPTLIGTNEVRQLLASGTKPLFVDVRLPKDFSRGRIPGAINLPVDDLEQRWSSLPKDKTIVLYESGQSSGEICAASRAAGRILLAHGFPSERVEVYQDGLAGWEKAGLKVER